ncbi:SsrA-binding protein SmpB [Arenicella xantha]|uniref:SsrA-binding protein n=1 Tax=Arenicella xantha TaxID=644221 RepID=A0A395JF56_9GAMM|nr:SsrA-binding protein SmpB [Arenicella xantha]RBP48314.1 SsrA-binding protein [Arenicella xantha]
MAKPKKAQSNTIATNKKARFDFFIEEDFEAGLVLEGWEVKSMRAGRVQLKESYVTIHKGELFLHGAHISPLNSASTHIIADPVRKRKLLMKGFEISRLIGQVERAGYTIAPLDLYWSRGRAKLKIGLAKGKKQHDKRATIKERDWKREQHRVLKGGS